MNTLCIISGSIRPNALTRRIALHLHQQLVARNSYQISNVDLASFEFPIWKEVFQNDPDPPRHCRKLHSELAASDAFLLVSPEYNGSYSLAIKNLIDYYEPNLFSRKAIGIATVSTGRLGGIRSALQLQQLCLAIYAVPVPQMLLVPDAHRRFDDNGQLLDESFSKQVTHFLEEFLWYGHALYQARTNLPVGLP
ncbi:MAG: NAD(P)H-dependent oxidoreductase [Chitinophagales bacterium]|nr:NAD(P)H-dependent oxidoreductase [Chitinophagales bacterium]